MSDGTEAPEPKGRRGWVDTTTLQKVYQVADADTMESVVLQPKRLRKLG